MPAWLVPGPQADQEGLCPYQAQGAEAAACSGQPWQFWERGGVSREAALRSKHQPCRGLAVPLILTHHAGSQRL